MSKALSSKMKRHLKGFGMYYYLLAFVVIFGYEVIARLPPTIGG